MQERIFEKFVSYKSKFKELKKIEFNDVIRNKENICLYDKVLYLIAYLAELKVQFRRGGADQILVKLPPSLPVGRHFKSDVTERGAVKKFNLRIKIRGSFLR